MFLDLRETRVVMSLPHAEKMTGTTGRTKRQWDEGIKGIEKGRCIPPSSRGLRLRGKASPRATYEMGK